MPQLVEAGKVYKAIPPLYGIKNGKKVTYFTNQIDFVQYVQKTFIQNHTLTDLNKKALSTKDITSLFVRNEEYVYELERLATTYAVDPRLLEMALFNYIDQTGFKLMQKKLKDKFRFMNVNTINNSYVYEGTIAESNFLYMNDRLFKDCSRLINIINNNTQKYYIMNGVASSLYSIMKEFDKSTPNNLQRYKGLGEMDPDQLAESVLLPTSDRTLIQYTLEDMKAELEFIRDYESDRSKLLQHVSAVKRSDLLD